MAWARTQTQTLVRSSNMGSATVVFVFGLLCTALSMPSAGARETFTYAANGTALALFFSLAIELKAGLRAMLRTDIVMLLTLFGLTFIEFLVPQKEMFDFTVSPQGAVDGSVAVLIGFIGIAIGRHFFHSVPSAGRKGRKLDLSPKTMLRLYLLAFLLGFLHIFLAVNFDVFEAIRQMALPRFWQAWGRGRLGGWSDLLVEVGALIYLIPPLAGCIYAQAARYSALQKFGVAVIFIFTLYFGFAGGTRNVFGIYMITFCGAYLALQPKITLRALLTFVAPLGFITLVAMYFMLEFRTQGLGNFSLSEHEFNGVFVDSNMVVISNLTEVFPRVHSYLGLEIPFTAIIRPIPRALWPDKPEGLSVGMEDALGTGGGMTLASTFVGEFLYGWRVSRGSFCGSFLRSSGWKMESNGA